MTGTLQTAHGVVNMNLRSLRLMHFDARFLIGVSNM
jgi:hypothetical protein